MHPQIDIDKLLAEPDPELILGPHDVPFVQYLRPNGRRKPVCIERSPEMAEMARRILKAGYHFDIEELLDGTVSMTVEPNMPDADGDESPIAMELCPNGPAVPATVDRLIIAAVHRIECSDVG